MGEIVLLHVSDIHCASGRLQEVLGRQSYDIVAVTGDFECIEAVEVLLSRANGEIAAVTGNADHAAIYRRLREAGVALDGSYGSVAGLRLAGVGGLDPGTSIRRLLSEPRRVDVLLSHHPPLGVLDRTFLGYSGGLEALWGVIESLDPMLHLFGHIHESPGWESRGARVYVNPGPLATGRYALVVLRDGVVASVSLERIAGDI